MKRQAALRESVLASLRKDGDSYSLELLERLFPKDPFRELQMRSMYLALRYLEECGLLESYEGPPLAIRGNRPRRYYRAVRF